MASLSRLLVELGLDPKNFNSGVDSAKGKLHGLEDGANAAGKSIGGLGGWFKQVGAVAGGFLAANVIEKGIEGIKGSIGDMISEAEKLQQTQLKTNAVFGKGAEDVTKWAEGAATSLGMSNGQAQTAADAFGNLFKNVGIGSDLLPQMSENMAGVVANVAAFNNADPTAVMAAINSGLAGNMRGLKQYGIVISQADIASEALRETGKKNVKELTTGELVQARYNVIMGKTANLTGTVKDRANTLAGASKILHAQLANLREEIGLRLLPLLTYGVQILIVLVNWFGVLLNDAIFPLISLIGNWLAPAFDALWSAVGPVSDALGKLADVIGLAFQGGTSFTDLLGRIPGPLQPLALALINLSSAIGHIVRDFGKDGLQGVLNDLPRILSQVGAGFAGLGGVILHALGDVGQAFIDAISNVDWGAVAGIAWALFKAAIVAAATGVIDLGSFLIDGAPTLGAALLDVSTRFLSWLYGEVIAPAWGGILQIGSIAIDGAPALGANLLDVASRFVSWLYGELTAGWQGILNIGSVSINGSAAKSDSFTVSDAAASIGDAVVTAVGALTDVGSRVVSALIGQITGVNWAGLVTFQSFNVGEAVGGAIHDAIFAYGPTIVTKAATALRNADWGSIFTAIGAGMVTASAAIPTAFAAAALAMASGLLGLFVGLIGGPDALNKFKTIAAGIVDGIKNGIDQKWTGFQEIIKGWVKSFIDWFKNPLGIASPSTVFMQIGDDLVQGLINGLGQAWQRVRTWIATTLDGFKTDFKTGMDNAATAIKTALGGIYDAVKSPLTLLLGLINDIGKAWNKLGSLFGNGGVKGADAANTNKDITKPLDQQGGDASGGLLAMMKASLGGQGSGAPDFSSALAKAATDAGEAFNQNLYAGLRKAQDSADAVYKYMENAAGSFVGAFSPFATSAGANFNQNLYVGMRAGQDTANAVFNQIAAYAGAFVSNVSALATAAGNGVNSGISNGMGKAAGSAQTFFNAIANAAGEFAGNLAALAASAGSSFNNGLSNGLGAAYSSANYFMAQIRNALNLGSQWSVGDDIGNSLGAGIDAGINAWANTIANDAANLVRVAVGAAKNAGGIASPSKKMMWIGDMLGQGAHIGFSNWIDPMGDAANRLVGAAMSGSGSGSGGGMGGNTFGDIHITVSGAGDPDAVADRVFAKFARETGLHFGV